MAQENAKKFMEKLKGDKALQEKLTEATKAYVGDRADEKALFDAVLAPIAKEAGYEFSYEDTLALAAAGGEMSDEELDQVAGGATCLGIGFGGTGDDNKVVCKKIGVGVSDNIMYIH